MSTIQLSIDDDGAILITIPPAAVPVGEMLDRILGRPIPGVRAPVREVNPDVPPETGNPVISALTDADGAAMSLGELSKATGIGKAGLAKRVQKLVKDGHITAIGTTQSRRYLINN